MWRVDKIVQAHLQSITDSILEHVESYNPVLTAVCKKMFLIDKLKNIFDPQSSPNVFDEKYDSNYLFCAALLCARRKR